MAYSIDNLTSLIEKKMSAALPDKFFILFDGWTIDGTHYVVIFATYLYVKPPGYDSVLLALSSLDNEESEKADEHYAFMKFVLSVFGKKMEDIVAIMGEKCSTNKALPTSVGCGFSGCCSHRFNLAVTPLMEEHSGVVVSVNKIMKRFKNPIPAAKLRDYTTLQV